MESSVHGAENDLEIRAVRVYFGTISDWCTAARQSLAMKSLYVYVDNLH
jgi:hypothetical protein